MKLLKSALIGACMASTSIWPVYAQWQGPTNAIPYGQGAGVSGFGFAGPGTNNQAFMGNTGAPAGFRLLTGADLPAPGASSLGGVQSLTCSSSNWFRTLSTSGIFGCSQPAFSDLTGSLTLAQMPTQATSTVLANVSGSTAVPSAVAPQAFNQAGFTGMAPCGYMYADNGGGNFNAGSASTTQFVINQVSGIVTCKQAAWTSAAWYADDTAVKVTNIIGGAMSLNHRLFDVTLQAGTGSCTATGVSDETHPGCNDVGAPCHVASTPKECTIFIVAKTSTPGTINDVGIIGSAAPSGVQNGPSASVLAVYPYFAPYARNYTTGQATFAAETLKWYIARLGTVDTIAGDTTLGFGRFTAVFTGSTASAFSPISIPTGYIDPNTKNVVFGIANTGAAASLCGVSPYGASSGTNWTTAQLDWPNNPGLSNLFIVTHLMGTFGNYGVVSSVAGCSVIVIGYTRSFGGTP